MKISDVILEESQMMLFKGESGSGKTVAAASFPKPYILDIDNRIAPVVNNPLLNKRDIEFDSYDNYRGIVNMLDSLIRNNPYKTVVVDGLTLFGRTIMNHLFDNRGISTSKDKEQKQVAGIPLMSIADYSGESSAIAGLLLQLRIIRNHGCNVILT